MYLWDLINEKSEEYLKQQELDRMVRVGILCFLAFLTFKVVKA